MKTIGNYYNKLSINRIKWKGIKKKNKKALEKPINNAKGE